MPHQSHTYTSPLRYPGGKASLANYIKLIIVQNSLLDGHYVELYAGGASVAWSLLFEEYVQRIHINDISQAVFAFWHSVVYDTERLCQLIVDTPVTIEQWEKQRYVQKNFKMVSKLELGFSTFFLNRTNRSGILNGGIIGGKSQTGKWKIDARFNKFDLIKRIQRIARYKNRINIYDLDAADFMKSVLPTLPQQTLLYLDPPYFHKGQDLYENHYTSKDHQNLVNLLTNVSQPWLVSYDACPQIDLLYQNYRDVRYNIHYSAQSRYAGSEVIFFTDKIQIPNTNNPVSVKLPRMSRLLL